MLAREYNVKEISIGQPEQYVGLKRISGETAPLIEAAPPRGDEADAHYGEAEVVGPLLGEQWRRFALFRGFATISAVRITELLCVERSNGSYATELNGAFYESLFVLHVVGAQRDVKVMPYARY
jgi:hypothetical protein